MTSGEAEIARLLQVVKAGTDADFQRLLPHVHSELRRIASANMRQQRIDHTLQTTALVNETVARLMRSDRLHWENDSHFLNVAARAMRQILIDHARARGRDKRRPSGQRLDPSDIASSYVSEYEDIEALDRALEKLAQMDPFQARLIELRFFLHMTMEQAAEVLGTSKRTAEREWKIARAWLKQELDLDS